MKMNHFAARCAAAVMAVAVTLTVISTPARADGQRSTGKIMADAGPTTNVAVVPTPDPLPRPILTPRVKEKGRDGVPTPIIIVLPAIHR